MEDSVACVCVTIWDNRLKSTNVTHYEPIPPFKFDLIFKIQHTITNQHSLLFFHKHSQSAACPSCLKSDWLKCLESFLLFSLILGLKWSQPISHCKCSCFHNINSCSRNSALFLIAGLETLITALLFHKRVVCSLRGTGALSSDYYATMAHFNYILQCVTLFVLFPTSADTNVVT